jgi:hypothetical protein
LILFPFLELFADEYRPIGKCGVGESSGPLQH